MATRYRWRGCLAFGFAACLAAAFVRAENVDVSAVPAHPLVTQADELLALADRIKISDGAGFDRVMSSIATIEPRIEDDQKAKYHFLRGWRATWLGDYVTGKGELETVADHAPDMVMRLRATSTLVNLLGVGRRYEEAFRRLNQLQEMLLSVRDRGARNTAMGEASQLLSSAGQYDQAEMYARQMMENPPPGKTQCMGAQHLMRARREGGRLQTLEPVFLEAIDACTGPDDPVFANTMRSDVAAFYLAHDRPADAVNLLLAWRDSTAALRYPALLTEYDATLAQAYLALGDLEHARSSAQTALADSISDELTEPRRDALQVLYQVEERAGHVALALHYHEQYMEADKAYLNDLTARSLAFQIVDQQLMARKTEVDALNRQNEILRLTSALDRKQVETSRLYIFLLAISLIAIVWLVLWLRRSQLRFMKLARRDGLTGICNREHFVEQAERVLAYGARSDRGACVILFDLDHFKGVNDAYGHAVGDEVLKRAVDVCRRALHACDVFGRLGGEEFAVLLPDCSPAQARARAEQLRLSIAATSATPSRPDLVVTASFGVASTIQCGFELHRMLVVADAALYRAKRAGRNCVFMGDTGDIPDSPYVSAAGR